MKTEREICAILFERKKISDDELTTVYSYTPIEVIIGTEVNVNGNKTLISKYVKSLVGVKNDNKNESENVYEFQLIDDTSSLSDKYVYGFPVTLDEKNKKDLKTVKKAIYSLIEDAKECKLVHGVNKGDMFNKLLLTYKDSKVSVNPNDFYDLFNTVYGITIDKIIEVTTQSEEEENEENGIPRILYSDEIYENVSKTVISQDEQIKAIAACVAENSRLTTPDLKSTILLCGPTGSGKTEIFRVIRDTFNIPIAIEDATEYTAASFKGKDVIEMLVHLIIAAGGDLEKAQQGMIIVDEIDKKVSSNGDHVTYTTAVLDSLLKMAEGHGYSVPIGKGIEVPFDTSNVTFAFLGAFSGIEQYVKSKTPMGFLSQAQVQEYNDIQKLFTDDSLKKYGLKPEFLGRCDLVALNNLNIEDFIKILKTSNKSQLLLYKYLLEEMGINFIYDEATIETIAKKAFELGVGARGLRKIVKNALAIARYQLYSRSVYKELIISPETIENNRSFILR